jgi:hypothetical protein
MWVLSADWIKAGASPLYLSLVNTFRGLLSWIQGLSFSYVVGNRLARL